MKKVRVDNKVKLLGKKNFTGMQTGVALGGNNVVALSLIGALSVIVVIAMIKEYSVELEGETTGYGVKGSLKLQSFM